MSRKSQRLHTLALGVIALVLMGMLSLFVYLQGRVRFPETEAAETVLLPNYDIEIAAGCASAVLVLLALHLAFGRARTPSFSDELWSKAPEKDMHPAVFGRLCRWNKQNSGDAVATILHLANRGLISIEHGERIDAGGKAINDWRLVRTDSAHKAANPLDEATLKMLFGVISQGADSVWCGEIHSFARHEANSFAQAMRSWQACATTEFKAQGHHDRMSEILRTLILGVAVAALLLGVFALLGTGSFVPLACCILVSGVALLVARGMPRLSIRGAEAYAKSRALRNWMRELAAENISQEESPSQLEREGASLIPYAFVLRETEALAALAKQAENDGAPRRGSPSNLAAIPNLLAFVNELAVCIMGSTFAAESTVAQQSAAALAGPVGAVTRGAAAATGVASPEEDHEDLFPREK